MNSLSISAVLTPPSPLLPTTTTSLKLQNPSSFKSPNFSIQSHLSSSSFPTSPNFHSKTPKNLENLGLRFHAQNSTYPIFSSSTPVAEAPQTAQRGGDADPIGMLLRERIVFLRGGFNDFIADGIISQLLLLDAQDPTKDIRLFLHSPGGSLSAALAIYDVVQLVRADVSTVALGFNGSEASIILGGGTKGKRLAMPNTRIVISQPSGGTSGEALDVEVQAKEIMHNKYTVTKIISDFTGRTFEQVEKDIDSNRIMSPIEGVEYGIIDEVIDRDSILPLKPVPENVKPRVTFWESSEDLLKFVMPDIPDDEIY